MNKSILTISIVFFTCIEVYSQDTTQYVVISFERERNISKQEKQKELFYWIVNIDSTTTKGFKMFPLYLSGYSFSDLKKCSVNDTINPFLITHETNYDFNHDYIDGIEALKELMIKKQVKVQTINKRWSKKFQETINVYAIAIEGVFYSCYLQSFDIIDYKGVVYLPTTSFEHIENFWDSHNARNVIYADYSHFFFINNSTGGSLNKIPYWRTPPR